MSGPSDIRDLHPLILQLTMVDQREAALLELSKKRETFPDLEVAGFETGWSQETL